MIPKETDGECFEEALARVCRCISGGGAQENADSDSDLEVVADSVTVNLRCPVSLAFSFFLVYSHQIIWLYCSLQLHGNNLQLKSKIMQQ